MIAKVKTWLALAGAFVLAMLGAFLWGAAKQKSNQKIRDLKARVSVLQNTKEIEDEVDLCLKMLFLMSFASGCATVISGECLWAEPIRPSVRDALTIGTHRQILAHNQKGFEFCDWE